MRLKAGLTLDQAASRLDLKRSGLHRLETGGSIPHVHVARSMMDLYDQFVPDLLDTIRAARRCGWWQDYRVPNRDYLGWEAGATTLREVAAARVPELLQTEDYARALLAGQDQLADEIETRRVRQERLKSTDNPLAFTVILDESALRNCVGDPRVMRAQLAYVAEFAVLANVQVRVLAASAGASVRTAGFRLLEFGHPDDPTVLFADCVHATVREESCEVVADARRRFDDIAAAVLPEADSVAFIRDLSHELYPSESTTMERKSA
jgi:transcriptional regulator with XRE-family HTH domain